MSRFGVSGLVSYGVTPRIEVDLRVPWLRSNAHRTDAELCGRLAEDGCDPTQGFGPVEARIKGLVLDQFAGNPLSVTAAAAVRYGELTSATRHRITAIGEGSMDAGLIVAAGRSGSLGSEGYFNLSVEAGGFYRSPNTKEYPLLQGDIFAPNSEVVASAEFIVSPKGVVSVGPAINGLQSLGGINFGEADPADPDWLSALRATHVQGGMKFLFRDPSQHVIAISAFRTIYASNNPADNWSLHAGIQFSDLIKPRERE